MSSGIFVLEQDFAKKPTGFTKFPWKIFGASIDNGVSGVSTLPDSQESQCQFLAVRFVYNKLYSSNVTIYVAINEIPTFPPNSSPFTETNSLLNPRALVVPSGSQIDVRNVSGETVNVNLEIFRKLL